MYKIMLTLNMIFGFYDGNIQSIHVENEGHFRAIC